jgi:hypothetical protein
MSSTGSGALGSGSGIAADAEMRAKKRERRVTNADFMEGPDHN